MSGSIYKIPLNIRTGSIAEDIKILLDDVTFTENEFKVGNGGIVRLYFAFETSITDVQIAITLDGTGGGDSLINPMKLNGDNDFIIKTDGYYRFDIGVDSDTKFNLAMTGVTSQTIDEILELSLHKIVFGA